MCKCVHWCNAYCPGGDLSCTPHSPGGVQVMQGWEVASDHLLCRVDDALQSALVLGSGCSVPDSDGGGEYGLTDGWVEVHHHCLWQTEFLQLPPEVHPLFALSFHPLFVRMLMFSPHLNRKSWLIQVSATYLAGWWSPPGQRVVCHFLESSWEGHSCHRKRGPGGR